MYEIRAGRWVRNGSQIRSQVRLYVECHFCNSMQDLDIFLLQVSSFQFKLSLLYFRTIVEMIQLHLGTICFMIRWSRFGCFLFDTCTNPSFVSVYAAEEFDCTGSEMLCFHLKCLAQTCK